MLTAHESLLVAIIIALFVLIFTTRLKIELIAILIMLTLNFTGLVTTEQALSGFSSSVVVTLIGLFIITRALEDTGVVHWIARWLNTIGQGSEVKLITLFMLTGSALSLIMNNIAAGAVLLPAAVQVARLSNVKVSRLLLPMSFGTLVGGMATYLTTANIVMSELLKSRGLAGLNMLDFMPTGGLIVLASLVYMALIGRHLLPERETLTQSLMQLNLPHTYKLDERIWKIRVLQHSQLAGKTLGESGISARLGLTIPAMWHGHQTIAAPTPDQRIRPADELLVIGRKERVDELLQWGNELVNDANGNHAQALPLEPVEIVVAPRSNIIGKTLSQLRFRTQFGVTAVALWREGRSYRTDVGKIPLQVGDALLVVGKPEHIEALAHDRNYILPASGYPHLLMRYHKAPFAVLITAIVLLIAIFDLLPLAQVMLAGASAMVLTGCLSMEEFYDAIEWHVIFLIAGMLPLSIAMADTGLADRAGTLLVNLLDGSSPLLLVAGMSVLTLLIVQIIGGQVTALLVGPVAINAALQMNVSPQAMAVAVAMACSMAFLTPIAHPVNILMMGPGGYQFSDFPKVGFGMTLVTLLTMLFGLALFWGVH